MHGHAPERRPLPGLGPQGIGQLDRQALAGLVENPPYELKRWRLGDDVPHTETIAEKKKGPKAPSREREKS